MTKISPTSLSNDALKQDATLRELLIFPCTLNYKVMGYAKPELIDKILGVIRLYSPDDYNYHLKNKPIPKPSRNGNYHAVSIKIEAKTIEQVETLYRELAAIDIVRAVL